MESSGGKRADPAAHAGALVAATFEQVRAATAKLCAPLSIGDFEPQSMPDCSPIKWHLAHTTWFFDVFVLEAFEANYRESHPAYRVLFNSYYTGVGPRQERCERGLLTRPVLGEIWRYRSQIEQRVLQLLASGYGDRAEIARRTELGCHHEQQHQELMLTDLKHLFSRNALSPAYRSDDNDQPPASTRQPVRHPTPRGSAGAASAGPEQSPLGYHQYAGGLQSIGHSGSGFCYDNETPAHRFFLEPFELADRLVTNREFSEFIQDGGYQRPEFWLDQGFARATAEAWRRPLYWRGEVDAQTEFTLSGERPIAPNEPVTHVSYYEADAFARWAGARLPSEQEWEFAAQSSPRTGNFAATGRLHPAPASLARKSAPRQLFGDVWEWTRSPYAPYPGFRPAAGALGEYNGKFMCEQMVLRGGSCASADTHLRTTYRNFFYPKDRWQFSGFRLAKDAAGN